MATLPRGYITIDGQKLSTQDLHNYEKIQEFFREKYSAHKTSWHNFIISSAYAQFVSGPVLVSLYVASMVAFVVSAIITIKGRNEVVRKIGEYEEHLHNALSECETDRAVVVERNYLESESISNNTLIFMRKIDRALTAAGKRGAYLGKRPSCEDEDGKGQIREEWLFAANYISKAVAKACHTARLLQGCLDETKRLLRGKNLTIKQEGRYQNPKGSSYDDLEESFLESVLK